MSVSVSESVIMSEGVYGCVHVYTLYVHVHMQGCIHNIMHAHVHVHPKANGLSPTSKLENQEKLARLPQIRVVHVHAHAWTYMYMYM